MATRDSARDFNAALCYFGNDPTRKAMLAAWWFIENVADDDPAKTDLFFKVRELVRAANEPQPLRFSGQRYR